MTTPLALLVLTLATMRVTRLVNADAVLDTPRIWLLRRYGEHSKLAYFLTCPWCVSMWVTVPVLGYGIWAHTTHQSLWWWFPLLGLALSHLTGLLAQLDRSDMEIVIEEED